MIPKPPPEKLAAGVYRAAAPEGTYVGSRGGQGPISLSSSDFGKRKNSRFDLSQKSRSRGRIKLATTPSSPGRALQFANELSEDVAGASQSLHDTGAATSFYS